MLKLCILITPTREICEAYFKNPCNFACPAILIFLWLVPSLIAIYIVIIPTFKTLCIAIVILLVTIFYMQLVAKAGLTLLATFNYKVLPQVTTELCYKESQIRVKNCIGVYHQWADNTLELFAWYAWRGICG